MDGWMSPFQPPTKNGSPLSEAAGRVERGMCAGKPNSVCRGGRRSATPREGDHLSGTAVASRLKRPTCTDARRAASRRPVEAWRPRCRSGTVRLGLTPRGVCRAAPVARNAGALLPHPFTPYRCRSRGGTALCCTCRRRRSARRRLPVRKHGALWCSDFPHRRSRCSTGTDGAMPWHTYHCSNAKGVARVRPKKGDQRKKAQRLVGRLRSTGPAYPSCRRPSRCRGPDRR